MKHIVAIEEEKNMNCEIFVGEKRNNKLLYVYEQKMIYKKKSTYKDIVKYECRNKNCKARLNLIPDGTCVGALHYVDHNHENEEKAFNEMKVLNKIKSDCIDIAETLGSETNGLSSVRKAFRRNCEE